MKFSAGDKVLIKQSGVEAEVLQPLSPKVIEVFYDGKTFPVHVRDVVAKAEKPFLKRESGLKGGKEMPNSGNENSDFPLTLAPAFYLSIAPIYDKADSEKVQELRISFLNQSSFSVVLEYCCRVSDKVFYQKSNCVIPCRDSFYLHEIPFDLMNDHPVFVYSLHSSEDEVDWSQSTGFHINDSLKLRPKKLFGYLNDCRILKRNSFTIKLGDLPLRSSPSLHNKIKVDKIKRKKVRKNSNNLKEIRSVVKGGFCEVDLHAESLGLKTMGVDNFEILSGQMAALKKAIDVALIQGEPSLVIIHGVGKGKLKDEVHRLLKSHPSISFFQHTWRPNYGYGATEAFFKQ